MASVPVRELPGANLPVLANDRTVVTRDGLNLNMVSVDDITSLRKVAVGANGVFLTDSVKSLDVVGEIVSASVENGDIVLTLNTESVEARVLDEARVEVADEGTLLTPSVKRLNFVGAGVTASVDMFGVISVNVPGGTAIPVSKDGTTLGVLGSLNVVGNALVTVNGDDVTLTIPDGSVQVFNEGVLVDGRAEVLNFVGDGVFAETDGMGVVTIRSAGLTVRNEGTSLGVAEVLNFVGNGIEAVSNAGVATVTVVRDDVAVLQDGQLVTERVESLNFVGAMVQEVSPGSVNVTVTGGGGSGSNAKSLFFAGF